MKRNDGSWDIFDDYVLDFALDRVPAGHAVALVTLIRIEGASPRPLGARDAGWQEIFNTDALEYGGRNVGNGGVVIRAVSGVINVALPAAGVVVLRSH